jgi:hypothetical protein
MKQEQPPTQPTAEAAQPSVYLRAAALRQALVNAVTKKDIADIAAVLLDKARQGDVAASRLVFSYTRASPTVK